MFSREVELVIQELAPSPDEMGQATGIRDGLMLHAQSITDFPRVRPPSPGRVGALVPVIGGGEPKEALACGASPRARIVVACAVNRARGRGITAKARRQGGATPSHIDDNILYRTIYSRCLPRVPDKILRRRPRTSR